MSITNSVAVKNAATDAVTGLIGATGVLNIVDASSVLLASFVLPTTVFAASASGTATANAITTVAGAAAGTAATYEILDSAGALLWSGTCSIAGGGGDMILLSLSIIIGQDIPITAWTHTALSA